MKHVKLYENYSDSMNSELSEHKGIFITSRYYGPDGISTPAFAVISNDWNHIAENLYDAFGVYFKEDKPEVTSIEEIMDIVEKKHDEQGNQFNLFEYDYKQMTPMNHENVFEDADLMDFGSVLKMGRRCFKNFDSLMG
jgi:hypothetical protein